MWGTSNLTELRVNFFMKESDLFVRGESIFYTPVIGTTDLPPQDVKARIEWSNTPDRLKTFFFGPEVIKLKKIEQGSIDYLVSIKAPTSGYSESALMAVIGTEQQLTGKSKKNALLYDYPKKIREQYLKIACGVIERFCSLKADARLPERFKKLRPLVMGHHGRELSRFPPFSDRPGIRTIILHHDHLVFVDESGVVENNWDDSTLGLDREAKLFSRKYGNGLEDFVGELNKKLKWRSRDKEFSIRKSRPVGYELRTRYDSNSISELAELLQLHFLEYSRLITVYFPQSQLVQPAFTFYLVPDSTIYGKVIISPNIFASKNLVVAGAPERAGLLIRRRPDIPPVLTQREKQVFWKMLTTS